LEPVQQVDGRWIVRRQPWRREPSQHKSGQQQHACGGQRLAPDPDTRPA
jgi:hypothetical protein